jgi:hypothetical protein
MDWYLARVKRPYGPTAVNIARGIYGTSALFAAFHSSIWPSPIPLFVLALALGWLAYRTQSLIPSMVLHGLFNAVTCVLLLFTLIFPQNGQPPGPAKGKAATSAVRRVPATSISSAVPGSRLPRRT